MEEVKPSFEVNIVKSNYSNITESEEVVKAKAARRNKWSVFHYMFNTNKPFTDIESEEFKELEDRLVSGFNKVVGNEENQNIYNYVVFKEHDAGTHNIRKFKCSGASEIGNEQHRLHFHVILAFFHNTLIKINYEKIKKDMEKACGIPLAVWYKVYSKADFNVQNYIMKYYDMSKSKKTETNTASSKAEVEKIE
jgi:hypothetical protein